MELIQSYGNTKLHANRHPSESENIYNNTSNQALATITGKDYTDKLEQPSAMEGSWECNFSKPHTLREARSQLPNLKSFYYETEWVSGYKALG